MKRSNDPDATKGAVEGNGAGDAGQGNANAVAALDESGMPADTVAISEDVLGANEDESQG